MSQKIVVVSGPTASGKSSIAEAIRNEIPSVIINADSLQIYDALPILTAKPIDFRNHQKYRLYDSLSREQKCSAAKWLELVEKEIHSAHSRGVLPVIVGGTGLYIKSLLHGFADVPIIDRSVMQWVENHLRLLGNQGFYDWLCNEDPRVCSKIHHHDTYRLLRAAAVIKQTGKSIYYYMEQKSVSGYPDYLHVFLEPDRDTLYKWCNHRFNTMVESGVIDEVKEFNDSKGGGKNRVAENKSTIEKAIGFQQITQYLDNAISLDEAIEVSQRLTRNYAKRQYTWFRNQMPEKQIFQYRSIDTIIPCIIKQIESFLGKDN